MNSDQAKSLTTSLGIILAAVFSVLVAVGKVTPDQSSILQNSILTVVGGAITVGLALWKLVPHSDSNKALAAEAIPGVQVLVNPQTAPQAVIDKAMLPTNDMKVTS